MGPLAIDSMEWTLDWAEIREEARRIVVGEDHYFGPAMWMFVGVLVAFMVTRATGAASHLGGDAATDRPDPPIPHDRGDS